MKIIDLAEKQLNCEILPKHIRYNDEDLYFDGVSYYDKQRNNDLLDILAMRNSAITHLYDEIEIIDEDKKIEKLGIYSIPLLEYENIHNIEDLYNLLEDVFKHFRSITNKLIENQNQLIDAVNELKGGNDG